MGGCVGMAVGLAVGITVMVAVGMGATSSVAVGGTITGETTLHPNDKTAKPIKIIDLFMVLIHFQP
jgi:hypothetical protein